MPLWKHGTDAQRRETLPKLCDGTWIAAIAMTEPESGSDVFSLATRAVPDGYGFLINGVKTLITNAPVADVAIVFALTDETKGFHGGITAFLVDLNSRGIERGERMQAMSVRSCAVGDLKFDNSFVPASAVLGSVGGGASVFTTAMDWERTCLFATHVGAMERVLELAIRRAKKRRISGHPIGKFQSVANKLVDMKVRLEAARLLVYRAAWRLERSRTPSMDAAMAKLFTSESHLAGAITRCKLTADADWTWITMSNAHCATPWHARCTPAPRISSEISLLAGSGCRASEASDRLFHRKRSRGRAKFSDGGCDKLLDGVWSDISQGRQIQTQMRVRLATNVQGRKRKRESLLNSDSRPFHLSKLPR